MSEKENRSEADRSRLGDKESFVNTASDDSNCERRGDNQLVPERATWSSLIYTIQLTSSRLSRVILQTPIPPTKVT